MLTALTTIYGIYAIATNVISSNNFISSSSYVNNGYLSLSLGSKQVNKTDENALFYYIQCWIGLAFVIIWFVIFFVLKYHEKHKE
jgi:hypothetical protein